MSKTVLSPGSATIINAISTGFGSAFGIGLSIEAEAKFSNCGINCSSDLGVSPNLMNLCVKKVLDYYNITNDKIIEEIISDLDFGNGEGIEIKTKSNLPLGSGLSSSSALSNAVVMASASLIADEFCLKPLSDFELVNLGIDASLEAGVTITGAFDDASASLFGGVTITDNTKRKILHQEKMPNYDVLVFMPDKESLSGSSDVSRMKLIAPFVEMAFDKAMDKEYLEALTLNGLLYASVLNFDNNIALDALESGALASGLSGTGSSFVAIVDDSSIDNVKEAWNSYDGKIIETIVDNEGTRFI
ncbi:shikimate kinase [Methanobrevibacter olleyae]|uniref:Shikimate kinase n=1 Tax=Methanobrevibacter olleyae TaxID=294671 RepID=A0A126R082_METOL|nr:shikimate kinase [Methanobrevibacter olleyae]AMK15701.1 shikimate kinase AroK [Methanobrevibacter olleyae]SFL22733.1 shikimate kinase [Methanobrevibacter olleyae]